MRPEQRPAQLGSNQQTQEQRERYIERVVEDIEDVRSQDVMSLERALNKVGVLFELEQAGILPVPDPQNAYHWEGEIDLPDEEAQLRRNSALREERLKGIQVGALLQRLFPQLIAGMIADNQISAERKRQFTQEELKGMAMNWITNANLETEILFELRLNELGLSARLEEIEWLEVISNPNPYNPEYAEERHDQWWKEHSQEWQQFSRTFEQRGERIRYMYTGAILNHLFHLEDL